MQVCSIRTICTTIAYLVRNIEPQDRCDKQLQLCQIDDQQFGEEVISLTMPTLYLALKLLESIPSTTIAFFEC